MKDLPCQEATGVNFQKLFPKMDVQVILFLDTEF